MIMVIASYLLAFPYHRSSICVESLLLVRRPMHVQGVYRKDSVMGRVAAVPVQTHVKPVGRPIMSTLMRLFPRPFGVILGGFGIGGRPYELPMAGAVTARLPIVEVCLSPVQPRSA